MHAISARIWRASARRYTAAFDCVILPMIKLSATTTAFVDPPFAGIAYWLAVIRF
jgi:hypothetical protein